MIIEIRKYSNEKFHESKINFEETWKSSSDYNCINDGCE